MEGNHARQKREMKMTKTVCKVDAEKLGAEISKEIDEMNNTGFGCSTTFAIGEYLGFQIQIIITRDEDDYMDEDEYGETEEYLDFDQA